MVQSIEGKPKVLALMQPKFCGAEYLQNFKSKFHLDVSIVVKWHKQC